MVVGVFDVAAVPVGELVTWMGTIVGVVMASREGLFVGAINGPVGMIEMGGRDDCEGLVRFFFQGLSHVPFPFPLAFHALVFHFPLPFPLVFHALIVHLPFPFLCHPCVFPFPFPILP